jgi:hypothetical protein
VDLHGQDEQFRQRVVVTATVHKALRELDDPALELLLMRQCADAGLVTFLLRAVGPVGEGGGRISQGVIDEFDGVMRQGVEQVVRGEVTAEAHQQAGWGVKAGGLGLRPGSAVALPAHVASLVEARPFVEALAEEMRRRGLAVAAEMEEVERVAVEALVEREAGDLRERLSMGVNDARHVAERLANRILGGRGGEARDPGGGESGGGGGGDGGGEKKEERRSERGPRLQHRLLAALDDEALKGVLTGLGARREAAAIVRHRRLADLGSSQTNHDWLWAVNPAHGYVLHPDDYAVAVRLRLGLSVVEYEGEMKCGECELRIEADDVGRHALLCAKGKRTIGHNRIRDHLADLARLSDGRAQTEVGWAAAVRGGGGDGDARRPADILTSAAPVGSVGSVAIDIGITTPHTAAAVADAALDPLDAYYKAKVRKNEEAARMAKWEYRPMIISAYGRAHPEAKKIVKRLALAGARRFGMKNAARIERAWWRNCGTLLMERACSMVTRCTPHGVLPHTLGGVLDGLTEVRHERRREYADTGGVVVGADGPTVPVGE